jgi:hypothetical protein
MTFCSYCRDPIAEHEIGVQCTQCWTPHHENCWKQNGGKCVTAGCGSVTSRIPGKLAPARQALAVGRTILADAYENARERFGGKTTVLLFSLSSAVAGLGLAPLLYAVHASRRVELEVVFGGLFAVLTIWITVLLYRGAQLEDDLDMKLAERSLGDYYGVFGRTDAPSGCVSGNDFSGCGGSDLDGVVGGIVLVVAIVVLIFVVLPLVAWLAVEIVFPLSVLAIYGTLYHALAFAVNGRESLQGRLSASLLRALGFALIYTTVVAAVMGAAVGAFHGASLPVRF